MTLTVTWTEWHGERGIGEWETDRCREEMNKDRREGRNIVDRGIYDKLNLADT